ncbi:ankyrin repeat domain-containing protein [Streptomyces sp. NPDC048507]|uniref:ankyrin repeat domain-containing protein n=1 Tax=Streptomyces sp. NPDC048507 TaxID=3365560 RepID=UPI003723DDB1
MNRRRRKKTSGRLVRAARKGDLPVLRALLRRGVAVDARDSCATTALYAASVHGCAPAVRVLLAAGAQPSLESGGGDEGTPLCAAAAWGYADVVRELLRSGADARQREDAGTGLSPLEWAEKSGHAEVATLLRAASGAAAEP